MRKWPLLAALAAGAVGCADNQNTLVVVQNQAVDRASTMCVVPGDDNASARSRGVLDLALVDLNVGDGYHGYPLVRNDLLPRADPGNGVQQTDTITLTGVDIQLNSPFPISPSAYFDPSFAGTINPGDTGAVIAKFIRPDLAKAFLSPAVTGTELQPPTVVVHFRVRGKRSDGDVTSAWVDFPVDVCRGCLTGGAPQACPNPPPSASDVLLGGCNPSQDEAISCCTQNGAVLCGSFFPTSGM